MVRRVGSPTDRLKDNKGDGYMGHENAKVDRRGFMTVAALAAIGGSGVLGSAPQARAAADQKGPMMSTAHRFMVGDFEVTTFLDGTRPGEGPHPIFGADQPAETVAALMEQNFLPPSQTVNFFTPVLVNTGSELILFDTGLGAGAQPAMGNLARLLSENGYGPDQIDVVVITHMHGDHIGGLMTDGQPTFANARYVTGAKEYDWWTKEAPEERAKPVKANVVPLAEKFTFIDDGGSVASGITAMAAFGHTPGHMIYNLESGGRRLVLTADTANHFVASLQRPDWEVQFDMDKAMAAETRKRVFGMLAADKVAFAGYHMPFPAVGFVEPMGEGFRYVPTSYQFRI